MMSRVTPAFSVLMAVYAKEQPDNLAAALASVFAQTLVPDEVILVKDGPLPALLEAIIAHHAAIHLQLKPLALERNVGLGAALNAGLARCSHEVVARMDSDDLCTPNRFERQVLLFAEDEKLAVVGAWVAEFETDARNPYGMRVVPESHEQISRIAKTRCPVNHPTVVFRKSFVLTVGGYNAKHLLEDYYLWARLMMAGYRFRNVQAPLVMMRTGEGLYDRRGGLKYALAEIKLFIDFYQMGFIGLVDLFRNLVTRAVIRLMPSAMRKWLYLRFARTHTHTHTTYLND